MKLYLSSLKMHIKSLIEYKKSFIMGFIAQIFVIFTYYFVILALFTKFDNIKGFTLYEVLLCFGVIQFGFSFNEVFARGVDSFDTLIMTGSFDQLLIRPRNVLLQVLCSKIDLVKLSRVLQALIVLVISLVNLNIDFTFMKIITLFLMLIGSIVIFFAIFLAMASYCFITVQGLEVTNILTYGGKHAAQYPIGIFPKSFAFVLTFIIPYAFVNYYPLLYLLGKSDNVLYAFSPLLIFIFLIPSLIAFKLGMKKYSSAGG